MAGIGEIGVRVSADTTDFAAAMNRTQQIAATSMARVEQANRIAQQAADKFVNSLKFQADTFGKSEVEILRYKANLLGASDAATPLIARIEELAKKGSHGMEEFSFKTAGAKRELLVLAHELSQGNYGRFFGSLMVLGERTGAAALLFNPLTVGIVAATAALGVMGYQVYKQQEQWAALGTAIKATGDYTGKTQSQMEAMAASLATGKTTIGQSSEALTALVATGRISGDQLQNFGRVALNLAADTGKSIDDIAKDLAKMPDGARKWAEEFQKTNHVFTAENIAMIDALDRQSRQAEATRVIIDALDQAHKRLADTLGKEPDQKGWFASHYEATKQWLADFVESKGRFDELNVALQKRVILQQGLNNLMAGDNAHDAVAIKNLKEQISQNDALIASLTSVKTARERAAASNAAAGAGGDARIKMEAYLDAGAKSDQQKYKDRIAAENKAYQEVIANLKANTAEYEAVVKHHKENLAEIEAEYAKKTKPKEYQDDAATKFLQRLREEDAQIQAQIASASRITAAKKEQAAFEQQIADLQGKKLTKEQESLVANQAAIRAQLAKNVADDEELRIKDEVRKLDEKAAQINEQMASSRAARNEQYQRQLGAFGLGSEAQRRVAALQQIYRESKRHEDELTRSTPEDQLGSREYLDELAKIRDDLRQSLADYDAYYADLKEKQGDWTNGATQAMQDYLDGAQNMAAQVQSALTGAFRGAEDALVSFVTTGKLNFSNFVTSVLTDIARIEARKMMSGFVSYVFGNMGSGIFGNLAGARADGGPVMAGGSYLVGERGPEIFTPSGSGTIIPNHALGGGDGVSININTYLSDNGASSSASGQAGNARAAADAFNARIKQVVTQETQQGGIIWRLKMGQVMA